MDTVTVAAPNLQHQSFCCEIWLWFKSLDVQFPLKFLVLKLLVFPHAYDIPYGIEMIEAVDPYCVQQSKVAGKDFPASHV